MGIIIIIYVLTIEEILEEAEIFGVDLDDITVGEVIEEIIDVLLGVRDSSLGVLDEGIEAIVHPNTFVFEELDVVLVGGVLLQAIGSPPLLDGLDGNTVFHVLEVEQ